MIRPPEGTFNSLSRDHFLIYWYAKQSEDNTLSTPSLGITFSSTGMRSRVRIIPFQLPLSGSLVVELSALLAS